MASQDTAAKNDTTAATTPTPPTTKAGNEDTNASHRLISEQMMEFLLAELVLYAQDSCATATATGKQEGTTAGGTTNTTANSTATAHTDEEERLTVAAEMASAKLERMGYSVGYRFTERLAQHKTWNTANLPQQDTAAAVAAQQLEAVKFLCKEVWIEVFRKQIDKLQTNHRGVFVLKDLDVKWLQRFPAGTEHARVTAIRLLAFPCGMIRGCLSNLGIPAVVSCDFLINGQTMSSCSFNIKVK